MKIGLIIGGKSSLMIFVGSLFVRDRIAKMGTLQHIEQYLIISFCLGSTIITTCFMCWDYRKKPQVTILYRHAGDLSCDNHHIIFSSMASQGVTVSFTRVHPMKSYLCPMFNINLFAIF